MPEMYAYTCIRMGELKEGRMRTSTGSTAGRRLLEDAWRLGVRRF